MMLETILLVFLFFTLLLLWVWAASLVWKFPGYRQFRETMEKVERAQVKAVRHHCVTHPISIKSLGERRVSELVDTSLGDDFNMRLVRFFGAMFLKEEAVAEAIWRLQLSCAIATAVLAGGAVWFVVGDAEFQSELATHGRWEVVPLVWEKLRSAELVMYAELLTAGAALVTILDAGLLLRKLNKELTP